MEETLCFFNFPSPQTQMYAMAETSESACSSRIRISYETLVFAPDDDRDSSLKLAAAAAAPGTPSSFSTSVVFKVQCILRLSVAGGNPKTEFLEVKDWREKRHSSSLELPCSRDGSIIDDYDNNQKISEALTVLRVMKESQKWIMDQLRLGAASLGLAPRIVVEICEVTNATLPLINEQGKRFMNEYEDTEIIEDNEIDENNQVGDHQDEVVPLPDNDNDDDDDEEELEEEEEEEEKEPDAAEGINALKKLILEVGDINEKDEAAIIKRWVHQFMDAVYTVAWPKKAKIEEEEAKEEKEERTCPICTDIFKPGDILTKGICCPQVFHRDCISMWTKRAKTCPWCRSSLPLLIQSAKGFIQRTDSDYFACPVHLGICPYVVTMWYYLSERSFWSKEILHDLGCECGCHTRMTDSICA